MSAPEVLMLSSALLMSGSMGAEVAGSMILHPTPWQKKAALPSPSRETWSWNSDLVVAHQWDFQVDSTSGGACSHCHATLCLWRFHTTDRSEPWSVDVAWAEMGGLVTVQRHVSRCLGPSEASRISVPVKMLCRTGMELILQLKSITESLKGASVSRLFTLSASWGSLDSNTCIGILSIVQSWGLCNHCSVDFSTWSGCSHSFDCTGTDL